MFVWWFKSMRYVLLSMEERLHFCSRGWRRFLLPFTFYICVSVDLFWEWLFWRVQRSSELLARAKCLNSQIQPISFQFQIIIYNQRDTTMLAECKIPQEHMYKRNMFMVVMYMILACSTLLRDPPMKEIVNFFLRVTFWIFLFQLH